MPGPRVLLVRFGALGDVILTTPLLRAIRRTHPDAEVTVVTKAAYAPVLAASPAVHRVEPAADGDALRDLADRLRAVRWDHRLDLHGSLRSRLLRLLVGGRWRGWRKPRLRRAALLWAGVDTFRPPVPAAERYFAAARGLGVQPDGKPAEVHVTAPDAARARVVEPRGPYVALAPGARHATKRWPPDHWRALAARLRAAGYAVVGVGTAAERALLPDPEVVSGFGLGLGPTAALLQGARAVVAHDSGLMHLATAVGTPVVALFGPTVPAFGYAPYRARGVVVETALPCRPCSAFGGAHCPMRHHRCMIEITPDGVAGAVTGILG